MTKNEVLEVVRARARAPWGTQNRPDGLSVVLSGKLCGVEQGLRSESSCRCLSDAGGRLVDVDGEQEQDHVSGDLPQTCKPQIYT
jgi:hypothetical protein